MVLVDLGDGLFFADDAVSVAIASAGHHPFGESLAVSLAALYPVFFRCLGCVAGVIGVSLHPPNEGDTVTMSRVNYICRRIASLRIVTDRWV